MPNVTCPSCGEKGKIPGTFIGTRIKCKMCGNAFLVTPPAAKPPAVAVAAAVAAPHAPAPVTSRGGHEIAVEGLDDSAWSSTPVAAAEGDADHELEQHEEATSSFTASRSGFTSTSPESTKVVAEP